MELSHITHIAPHHSAKKFSGRKRGELSYITQCPHLTTAFREEVLGPEARSICTSQITHHTSLTSHHILTPSLSEEVLGPEARRIITVRISPTSQSHNSHLIHITHITHHSQHSLHSHRSNHTSLTSQQITKSTRVTPI